MVQPHQLHRMSSSCRSTRRNKSRWWPVLNCYSLDISIIICIITLCIFNYKDCTFALHKTHQGIRKTWENSLDGRKESILLSHGLCPTDPRMFYFSVSIMAKQTRQSLRYFVRLGFLGDLLQMTAGLAPAWQSGVLACVPWSNCQRLGKTLSGRLTNRKANSRPDNDTLSLSSQGALADPGSRYGLYFLTNQVTWGQICTRLGDPLGVRSVISSSCHYKLSCSWFIHEHAPFLITTCAALYCEFRDTPVIPSTIKFLL